MRGRLRRDSKYGNVCRESNKSKKSGSGNMIERTSEEAVIALADGLPDTVFLVDAAGTIRYINARCEETLGYGQSDIIGRSVIELVTPADRDRTRKEASQVLAGQQRTGFENRYRHRNGSDVFLSWSAHWLASQRLRFGAAHNITALRQPMLALGDIPVPAAWLVSLTAYEKTVLRLLLTDASEKQIAERLDLAASAMHAHIISIFRKLGVRGRLGLMSLCLRGHASD